MYAQELARRGVCVVERVHYHGKLNTLSRLYGISNYVDQKDCVEPDQSEDRVFECLLYQETLLALLVQPAKAGKDLGPHHEVDRKTQPQRLPTRRNRDDAIKGLPQLDRLP
ncbi:hypothetical protein E4U56_000997 [Claviceps arundinis]|uniref:Uncharacterized protein n=1 Tax=Claviceps arundinis TaxID=1623583 RepID=A0A9P7MRU7_9HYPO|nr:hypothetical protein E4U56_000997 [Claviceps arundinis]